MSANASNDRACGLDTTTFGAPSGEPQGHRATQPLDAPVTDPTLRFASKIETLMGDDSSGSRAGVTRDASIR